MEKISIVNLVASVNQGVESRFTSTFTNKNLVEQLTTSSSISSIVSHILNDVAWDYKLNNSKLAPSLTVDITIGQIFTQKKPPQQNVKPTNSSFQ